MMPTHEMKNQYDVGKQFQNQVPKSIVVKEVFTFRNSQGTFHLKTMGEKNEFLTSEPSKATFVFLTEERMPRFAHDPQVSSWMTKMSCDATQSACFAIVNRGAAPGVFASFAAAPQEKTARMFPAIYDVQSNEFVPTMFFGEQCVDDVATAIKKFQKTNGLPVKPWEVTE